MNDNPVVDVETAVRPHREYLLRRVLPGTGVVLRGLSAPAWWSVAPYAAGAALCIGLLVLAGMLDNVDGVVLALEAARWESFLGKQVVVGGTLELVSADGRRRVLVVPFSVAQHGTGVYYEEMDASGAIVAVTQRRLLDRMRLGPPGLRRVAAVGRGRCCFWLGSPPPAAGHDRRVRMPEAAALIWEDREGAVLLARVDRTGRPAGLTVHPDEDDAYRQISSEFGVEALDWTVMPTESREPLRDVVQLLGISASWPPSAGGR